MYLFIFLIPLNIQCEGLLIVLITAHPVEFCGALFQIIGSPWKCKGQNMVKVKTSWLTSIYFFRGIKVPLSHCHWFSSARSYKPCPTAIAIGWKYRIEISQIKPYENHQGDKTPSDRILHCACICLKSFPLRFRQFLMFKMKLLEIVF